MRAMIDAVRAVLTILCIVAAGPGLADDGAATTSPVASASSPLDFEALKETRLFPLFAPSRRPPPPPVVEAPIEALPPTPVAATPPPAPMPPSVELVGIVEVDGGAVVLLKDPSSGRTSRVRAGQAIDDWELRVVGPRMVALVHPAVAEQHILRVARP